jgi:nucleotide-binding universal stress UspA family protein
MAETERARILVVTDLSPAGDVALAEAQRLAQLEGAAVAVVHAIPTTDAVRPLFPQRLADDVVWASQLPQRAEATLRQRVEAAQLGADAELFLERGTTAEGALAVIERWRPTLVVLGDDGTPERLVRHATVPIMVARESPRTGRVLVGTDFSDPSLPAIRAGAEAAARTGGELVVVHAVELNPLVVYGMDLPPMFAVSSKELHDGALDRLADTLQRLDVKARTLVSALPPAACLVDAATNQEAELIVVGTHGRSGLTRFMLGSVAETVIRRAPCSVLVVRLG